MRISRRPIILSVFSGFGLLLLAFGSSVIVTDAAARAICRGHQLLPVARPAGSCQSSRPTAYRSPDGKLTALVYPADRSLHATPDMESRVEIRRSGSRTIASKDYSSPRGANGYYVAQAEWTADAQYFVYSLSSSGGHSPWQSPIELYARQKNAFVRFSDLIGGNPTLAGRFRLTGQHTVIATTWQNNSADTKLRIEINLKDAIAKLPARQ